MKDQLEDGEGMKARPWILLGLLWALLAAGGWCAEGEGSFRDFRVCADPNNLPYSNQKLEGFENRIAELLARELDRHVTYTWWPQRRGFIRNTLRAGKCDVVMGVPSHYDPVLTTKPYYRSTYVFVYPKSAGYHIASWEDPILRRLKIGVHLIGDDYANSPPAHALGAKGIVSRVVGYSVYGREENPTGEIVEAVAQGAVDLAIVWGPIAGYFAQKQAVPLELVPVPPSPDLAFLPFSYDISLGVRKEDQDLKARLDELLELKASQIREILTAYGVPLVLVAENQTEGVAHRVPAEEGHPKVQKLNPYAGDPEAIAEGEALYRMLNCYGCHGMQGGGGMGPNLTDEEWQVGDGSDASLLEQIMKGRGNMPAYEEVIDEDQAWKLIAFIRTLYRGDPRAVKW